MNTIDDSALRAARGKRADARANLDKVSFALAKAQRVETTVAEQVRLRAQKLEAAQTKPIYEAASAALSSAKVDHLLAGKDLKAKQDAHALALSEFQASEACVSGEVERVIDSEKAASFVEFEAAVAKLMPLGAPLSGRIPNELNRYPGQVLPLSPKALRVLEALLALSDPLHTPLSGVVDRWADGYLSTRHISNPWVTRRAELNAGDTDDDSTPALIHKNGDGDATSSLSNV